MEEAVVGVALGALLLALVAYGYAGMQHGQSKGFLNWIVSQAVDTAKAAVWLGEQIVPLTSYLAHELGHAFNVTYAATARWVGGLENYVQMKGAALVGFAVAVSDFDTWLVQHEIPNLIKGIPGEASALVRQAEKEIASIKRDLLKLGKGAIHGLPGLVLAAIAAEFPFLTTEYDFIKKHWKGLLKLLATAGALTIPGVFNLPESLRKWVNRELASLWKRIKAREKTIVGVVGAAAVAEALRRLGVGWIRCTNWKRVGRTVCGLPAGSITDLLSLVAGLAVLEQGLSLEAFAQELLDVQNDVIDVILAGITEFKGITT